MHKRRRPEPGGSIELISQPAICSSSKEGRSEDDRSGHRGGRRKRRRKKTTDCFFVPNVSVGALELPAFCSRVPAIICFLLAGLMAASCSIQCYRFADQLAPDRQAATGLWQAASNSSHPSPIGVDIDEDIDDDESIGELIEQVQDEPSLFDDLAEDENEQTGDNIDKLADEDKTSDHEHFYGQARRARPSEKREPPFLEPDLVRTGAGRSPVDSERLEAATNFDDHQAFDTRKFYSSRPQERGQAAGTPTGDHQEASESFQLGRQSAQCALVLERGLCVSFATVEWALRAARRALNFRRPSAAELNSEEPSESAINSVGQLVETTTRILANRLQLGWSEVAYELERIDMRQTSLWDSCPLLYRTAPACLLSSRYRTHSGRCNNIQTRSAATGAPLVSPAAIEASLDGRHLLLGASLGSANMPFARMLPADYADSIGAPRRAASGAPLPPARLVSLELHPDIASPSAANSALFMSWGQLINHDLALASGAREATGHEGSCCVAGWTREQRHVCMPILIGPADPIYAKRGVRCHEFKRSLAGLRLGCSLGQRTQLNTISAFVDANFVYGSSRSTSGSLRRHHRGLLEMWNYFSGQPAQAPLKPLLPPQLEHPDEECRGRRGGRFCFRSGDSRTNQQVQLVVLHTIHTRQHNRLARALARLNPHWEDGRLYHEARHIHIAQVQHILLTEYLPQLLGQSLLEQYKLAESPLGSYWDHYEPNLNPGISQAFAAAAFRQGHSTVPSQVFRFNNLRQLTRVYQLRQLFRQPWPLYEPGAMDEFLLGLLEAPANGFDPFVSDELSGHLMQEPGEQVGMDLVAINLQRGRDQGVAGYNAFREWCGLGRLASFEELGTVMNNRSAFLMGELYESVDDIDLFSGGLSEFPLEGAQLGPTFACIIGRQFSLLRSGDRFWFESSGGPQAFTLAQLDSIKQTSLASLICANSDTLVAVQQLALQLSHPVLNPRVPCEALPDLDIGLWFEPAPTESW